jgi:hypothetical protein
VAPTVINENVKKVFVWYYNDGKKFYPTHLPDRDKEGCVVKTDELSKHLTPQVILKKNHIKVSQIILKKKHDSYASGTVFTTLHFLCNLRIGTIS